MTPPAYNKIPRATKKNGQVVSFDLALDQQRIVKKPQIPRNRPQLRNTNDTNSYYDFNFDNATTRANLSQHIEPKTRSKVNQFLYSSHY